MLPNLKKPNGPTKPPAVGTGFSDKEFEKEFPYLAAFLLQTTWADKSERLPGTITVFVQDGQMKLCVNDRDLNRSAFVTAPTWAMLIQITEDKLSDDSLEWRTKK